MVLKQTEMESAGLVNMDSLLAGQAPLNKRATYKDSVSEQQIW